jgi:hypothetical protein
MDLTRDITYRGFTLNDSTVEDNFVAGGGTGTGITGCVVDSVDTSDVDVVQFTEKRSQQDGLEAGEPFLGGRRIRMAGTLYGVSRAALFDQLADLRAALSPVMAYRDEPLEYGYQPLYFSVPTTRTDAGDYPSGVIPLRILAMPRAFQATINRDMHGGDDTDALAIPWQATFVAKDPTVQGEEYQDYDLSGSSPVSGNFVNRGNYLCPLNMLIATGTAAGTISFSGAGTVFTITVPASTGNRTIRFKGEDKVLTVEEDSVEVTRMDLLSFTGTYTWPLVEPGTTAYTVTFNTVTHTTGSIMWFYERYA